MEEKPCPNPNFVDRNFKDNLDRRCKNGDLNHIHIYIYIKPNEKKKHKIKN